MKIKTWGAMALAVLALAACHRGDKRPPRMDNSKLAISLSKPAKGDKAIYDLPAWAARILPWCCCPMAAVTP